jgi:hypothetical protein
MGWDCWKLTSPNRRGVPDRLILLPYGVAAFVEVKSPKGRLTLLQERTLKRLKDRGHITAVVYDKEQVDDIIHTLERSLSRARTHNRKA